MKYRNMRDKNIILRTILEIKVENKQANYGRNMRDKSREIKNMISRSLEPILFPEV